MATNPNADWAKVNEMEKTVWGSNGTATAQDATFAANHAQARTESGELIEDNEEGSSVWLWIGGILLLAGLAGGGYYYYENYYKKGK